MQLSNTDIFKKAWLWSAICGAAIAMLYAFISGIGPRWMSAGDYFFDLLILLGVLGSYFGAGLIGHRITEKYYPSQLERFTKLYIRYSIITCIMLVALTFSPFSFLGLLWSLVPPFCVLRALAHFTEKPAKKPRATTRARTHTAPARPRQRKRPA